MYCHLIYNTEKVDGCPSLTTEPIVYFLQVIHCTVITNRPIGFFSLGVGSSMFHKKVEESKKVSVIVEILHSNSV